MRIDNSTEDCREDTGRARKEQRMRRRTLLGSSDPLVAQAVSLRLSGFGFFDEGLLAHDDHDAGIGDVEAAAVRFGVIADLGSLRQAHMAIDDRTAYA